MEMSDKLIVAPEFAAAKVMSSFFPVIAVLLSGHVRPSLSAKVVNINSES